MPIQYLFNIYSIFTGQDAVMAPCCMPRVVHGGRGLRLGRLLGGACVLCDVHVVFMLHKNILRYGVVARRRVRVRAGSI